MDELKQTLRRLSKLVLAGYGGPSLLFFGVSLTPWEKEQKKEEAKLADAIDASEKEAAGEDARRKGTDANMPGAPSYSWWDVLMGKHDHEIFLNWAKSHSTPAPSTPDSPVSVLSKFSLGISIDRAYSRTHLPPHMSARSNTCRASGY